MQRELDGRRVDVICALRRVDVVKRVDGRVLAAWSPDELESTVGDYLVGVHVGRRAGAALDDVDDELIVESTLADLSARRDDGVGDRVGEQTQLAVGLGRGLLDRG